MPGRPLTPEEVKALGQHVGRITGGIGYITGILGAWALYITTRFLSTGHNPFKEAEAHPSVGIYAIGVILGILLTMIGATIWAWWEGGYKGCQFKVAKSAGATAGGLASGLAQGAGAFLVMVFVILYAMTVYLMWILGTVALIALIAF